MREILVVWNKPNVARRNHANVKNLSRRLSPGEEWFALQCRSLLKIQPVREYQFAPDRRWRFDFAWPESRVAVEIEGGTWIGGAHNRGRHFSEDCEKYSVAAALGWRVIRATTDQVRSMQAFGWAKLALRMVDETRTFGADGT